MVELGPIRKKFYHKEFFLKKKKRKQLELN